MTTVCFYFQVHQPFRLRRYRVFDFGNPDYFDDARNREILRRVAHKCYLPMNELLANLIRQHQGRFRVAFAVSGTALEQFEMYAPEVLESFRQLARTGCVEFLAETYYHSLSFVFDREEFDAQVELHVAKVEEIFGQRPRVFRNTELIFNNDLAAHVSALGFSGVLAEGVDRVLGWRSPNFLYTAVGAPDLKLLLKNYRLSDDVAFRFSDVAWTEHPLTAEKYSQWVGAANGSSDVVNLFMDYETFGEHQWTETGIFEFMARLPEEVLRHPDNAFGTPSEVVGSHATRGELDYPDFTSWADIERDLTAWLGNPMQEVASRELYDLRCAVLASGDAGLLSDWRKLTTSDHLYYMCTKWFADGDVHKYFNPFDSPYEGYINFTNALNDLADRAGRHREPRIKLSERPSTALRAALANMEIGGRAIGRDERSSGDAEAVTFREVTRPAQEEAMHGGEAR
jgi:alpha-amylase